MEAQHSGDDNMETDQHPASLETPPAMVNTEEKDKLPLSLDIPLAWPNMITQTLDQLQMPDTSDWVDVDDGSIIVPIAMDNPPPNWINADFLETVLNAEIESHDIVPIKAASCLFRVSVTFTTGEKESVIMRCLVSQETDALFTREVHMYNVVLPKLKTLLDKALPDGGSPIFAPQHIYSDKVVLVLEDLLASGFYMLEEDPGLNVEQGLLVMRTIAQFHAASVILQEQEPKCMEIFCTSIFSEPAIQENMRNFFTDMTKILADEIQNWPEYGPEYANKLRVMSDKMVEMTLWAAQRKDGRFKVLTHDDISIDNMMFNDRNEVRLIDFQSPHLASPGNDLQIFILSSISPELRMSHLDTFLEEYHNIFCGTLNALGYEKPMMTFQELKQEYTLSSLYGMIHTIVFLADALTPDDGNLTSMTSTKNMFESPEFRNVMKKMMTAFEEQGAFESVDEFLN